MSDADCLVTIEDRARVRILRLNRPNRKNALTGSLGWAIVNAIREAAADDDVWVIGLTGTGDGFCSGLDLSGGGSDEGNPFSPQSQMTDDLGWVSHFPLVMREECEKPIVGGINGVEIGAARRGLQTEDSKEAVRAIMEKRKPVFTGR
jgi:2-(1,2-epoxy-1,2-dihydrophenyl)acetyl-CoA isomerase